MDEEQKEKRQVEKEMKYRFQQLSKSRIDLTIIDYYARAKLEAFNNSKFNSSNTTELKDYEKLKAVIGARNFPSVFFDTLEQIVNENTYELYPREDKLQIEDFVKVIGELKKDRQFEELKNMLEFSKKAEITEHIDFAINPVQPETYDLINWDKPYLTPEENIHRIVQEISSDKEKTYAFNKAIDQFNKVEVKKIIEKEQQKSNIMETNKEFDQLDYLKKQLKYLGFGEDEKLHKDLKAGIDSPEQKFEIKTQSDKALPWNKVEFTLNFNKTEQGGIFFNSYNANLENQKGENISQNFKVTKENTFTAKEAVNLLEGRSVKIEFTNPKTDIKEDAFVKLDLKNEKNKTGNYNYQTFYQNYGVDAKKIVENSNLVFDKPEWKNDAIKSLEKGNIVNVKIKTDDNVIDGKAFLNPQYKTLNLYDREMNRINTNKPIQGLDESNQEKANVRQQSASRGI
ncbi:hypothetical protein [Vaginella massiliensis]|uniref:hypothetical protein n=1 Tax=Vaginella massiliensis TaxID=1816680 RepID=UPI00083870A8|nr:hypothetical protein [Vaginella massiliensis]